MKKFMVSLSLLCSITQAWAAETTLEKIRVDTSAAAVMRGADTLMEVCHGCHTLKYIKYKDLALLGIDKNKIDEWRGDQPLDAPLASQMSDDAAVQSFGKSPPDLSLIAKARAGGANYLYSYLVGYYNTPEGVTGNHIFPETKMPDVLGISSATNPAQRSEIQGKAREVVSFLYWSADPHEEERHRLGYYVIAYLIVLTALLYFVKARIWSRLR